MFKIPIASFSSLQIKVFPYLYIKSLIFSSLPLIPPVKNPRFLRRRYNPNF